jgi:gluconokinase
VIVVLMGPAGAGKTTIGQQLAHDLGWPFLDADSLHSPEAVESMRHGRGLTDAEREPWLLRVRDAIRQLRETAMPVVVACSALKQKYRDLLAGDLWDVKWVYLDASEGLLRDRLASRTGHFAAAGILPGQLADLERPTDALVVPAALPVDEAVTMIRTAIGS